MSSLLFLEDRKWNKKVAIYLHSETLYTNPNLHSKIGDYQKIATNNRNRVVCLQKNVPLSQRS